MLEEALAMEPGNSGTLGCMAWLQAFQGNPMAPAASNAADAIIRRTPVRWPGFG